jgi:hypothetical protein
MFKRPSVDAQLLLNDIQLLKQKLKEQFDIVYNDGILSSKSEVLEITTRRCTALLYGTECRVFDLLVIEVPAYARRRGIMAHFVYMACLHAAETGTCFRIKEVLNSEFENFLIKCGFILDGEYYCAFNPQVQRDALAARGNGDILETAKNENSDEV